MTHIRDIQMSHKNINCSAHSFVNIYQNVFMLNTSVLNEINLLLHGIKVTLHPSESIILGGMGVLLYIQHRKWLTAF